MMKRKLIFIFPALLFLLQFVAFGTQAQKKVKKYCEVAYSAALFDARYHVDYGQDKNYSPIKDSVYVGKLLKVKAMKTRIEVLNYMSALGWDFVSVSGDRDEYRVFIFSREFDPAELNEKN